MPGFDDITRCLQLTEAHMARALESSADAKKLVVRLAGVSRPSDGGPKILILLARLATGGCTWLDGELRVELSANDGGCALDLTTELGAGMRERVFPTFSLKIPLEEFARALEVAPHVVAPLTLHSRTRDKLVLSAQRGARLSLPPPIVVTETVRVETEAFVRATMPPTFDLEAFAREEAGSAPLSDDPRLVLGSLAKAQLPTPVISQSEGNARPTAPPNFDLASFARNETGTQGPLTEADLIARLGGITRTPQLRVDPADVPLLALDRTSGFLLAQIDGISTLEMILDVSGMSRLEALRILYRLFQQELLDFE